MLLEKITKRQGSILKKNTIIYQVKKNGILLEKETEQKFDVQIWDSTDFIIDNLKEKIKK